MVVVSFLQLLIHDLSNCVFDGFGRMNLHYWEKAMSKERSSSELSQEELDNVSGGTKVVIKDGDSGTRKPTKSKLRTKPEKKKKF